MLRQLFIYLKKITLPKIFETILKQNKIIFYRSIVDITKIEQIKTFLSLINRNTGINTNRERGREIDRKIHIAK